MSAVKLANVRIAFCESLFTAKGMANDPKSEPRHSAVFIIEPGSENEKLITKAVTEVAIEKWKDKAKSTMEDLISKGRVCFEKRAKTNSDGEVYDGFEGTYSVRASSKSRPTVVDRDRTQLSESDGRPYSGCYVNAYIEIWAQDNQWGKRVNATLSGVQFVKDGDAFSSTKPISADKFDDLGAGEDDLASDGGLI